MLPPSDGTYDSTRAWAGRPDWDGAEHLRPADDIAPPPGQEALPRRLGRFELRTLLGTGGMGRVYGAWDDHLQRHVAIKTLRFPSRDGVRRFVREARLQAQLDHPGICQVYEVGEDDEPYIVMRRLQGRPLDRAAAHLGLEQKLVLMKRVAEAVHEAHRSGLIHRDLKPANIFVEERDGDPLHPVVLDFGIARATGHAGITQDGALIGTPAFMAPEQARGEHARLDRRTDVYALGATLYCLLAERPPFVAAGPELLLQIVGHDPAGLAQLGVPADIEAVVFKCLEKEPERRYASAQDLALDLERYLDGRPVVARPINLWSRWRKKARRNPVATRIAAVSALLLVGALAWGAWTAHQADRRERFARELTRQVKDIEAEARFSQLAPLHDLGPDRDSLAGRIAGMAEMVETGSAVDRRAGHFAMGRGYLALGDLDAARHHLELAWADGEGYPEAGSALAETLSRLYRRRLAESELLGDWQARTREIETLAAQYGHPARSILSRLATTESATIDGARALHLQALALFHDDRFQDGLDLLQNAAPAAWSHETAMLEGDIHRTWAVRKNLDEEPDRALDQLMKARQAYARALEVAESEPALYLADAQAAFQAVAIESRRNAHAPDWLEHGLQRLDDAAKALPESGEPWLWRARLLRTDLQVLLQQRQDPGPTLHEALRAAQRAQEDPSTRDAALQEAARCHWTDGKARTQRGEDPLLAYNQAVDALQAIPEARRNYTDWVVLGMAHADAAQHLTSTSSSGASIAERFAQAAAALEEAANAHSSPYSAWFYLGVSLYNASGAPATENPQDLLKQALNALAQAELARPDQVAVSYYIGLTEQRLAQAGDSAAGFWDVRHARRAEDALKRALRIAPEMFQVHLALGELAYLNAVSRQERGKNPAADFAAARSSLERAFELAPQHPLPRLILAWTAYFEAKGRLRSGQDPTKLLDEATQWIEPVTASVTKATTRPGVELCKASIDRLRGEWLFAQGADPEPFFRPAEHRLSALAESHPSYAETFRSMARIWTRRGEFALTRDRDPSSDWKKAQDQLSQVQNLRDNNNDWLAEAQLLAAQARHLEKHGHREDARGMRRQALERVRRCRALRPDWIDAEGLEAELLSLESAS